MLFITYILIYIYINVIFIIGIILKETMIMNDKKRKMIEKLNKDNEHLNEAHKSWVEYSKGRIVIGLLTVIVLLILIFK